MHISWIAAVIAALLLVGNALPATQAPVNSQPAQVAETLTQADAVAIALAHAGLAEDQVQRLQSKLDREDGILVYEVEFIHQGFEYDYEIHAQTGAIMDYDREFDD